MRRKQWWIRELWIQVYVRLYTVYVSISDCIVLYCFILFSLFVLFRFVSFRRIYSLIIHNAQAPTHTVTHTYAGYEFSFVQLLYTITKKNLLHCSWAMARRFLISVLYQTIGIDIFFWKKNQLWILIGTNFNTHILIWILSKRKNVYVNESFVYLAVVVKWFSCTPWSHDSHYIRYICGVLWIYNRTNFF